MLSITIAGAVEQWTSLYGKHAALRSLVTFGHVGALVVAGGLAIVADRAMLHALDHHDPIERRARLVELANTHWIVMTGLASLLLSGFLLFAADVETFLYSRFFWLKMGLIVALLVNGVILRSAEQRSLAGADAWSRLRVTTIASATLWLVITLIGCVLPNVG